jgi:drug/metabolite transporter (DMT)-like permease
VSNLRIGRVLVDFPLRYAAVFIKRFVYCYVLRDLNVGTIETIAGLALLLFGLIFGGANWAKALATGTLTPSGTVMLASIAVILGVQFLLAAVSFAAYFLLAEHNVGVDDPLRVILWAFVAATVAMNLVQPIWTTPDLPATTDGLGRLDGVSVDPWLVIAVVVVLGTVVPFFLGMLALRHLPATIVTVVAMLEPVIAVVLGWAWFRESLTAVQVVGAVAVLAGIVLAQTSRRVELTIPAP